jgi:Flp pilus assembly pilin Flp
MRLRPRRLVHDSGQTLAEYALILALASLGIISALIILQGSLGNSMQASGHQIDAAASGHVGEPLPEEGGQDGGYGTGGPVGHGKDKGNSGNGSGNGGPDGRR